MTDFATLVEAFKQRAQTVVDDAKAAARELDTFQNELRELSKQITAARKQLFKTEGRGRKKKVVAPQPALAAE